MENRQNRILVIKLFLSALGVLFIFLSASCLPKEQEQSISPVDTRISIYRQNLSDALTGQNFRTRAVGYKVITENDTSAFMPIIEEIKEDSSLSLDFNLPYKQHKLSYSERMKQLELILPEAAGDFNLSKLASLEIGRFMLTANLAVEITKEYTATFGHQAITTHNYDQVREFLLKSKLGTDFNALFKPYNLHVKSVRIEKAFFVSTQVMKNFVKLDTVTHILPDQILDCITWLQLEPIE